MKTFTIIFYILAVCYSAFASSQTVLDQDKPSQLYVDNYSMTDTGYVNRSYKLEGEWDTIFNGNVNWMNQTAGNGYWASHDMANLSTGSINWYTWDDDVNWSWNAVQWPNAYATMVTYSSGGSSTNTGQPIPIIWQRGDINVSASRAYIFASESETVAINERRSAQTTIKLKTGGKSIANQKKLFRFSGSAGVTTPGDQGNASTFSYGYYFMYMNSNGPAIDSANINICGYGSLDKNSVKYILLTSASDVDVTPNVANVDYYKFGLNATEVQTKADWQQFVQHEIDANSGVTIENYLAGNGFLTNRANINAVYSFYQKLFTDQPATFLWPGLAKLAGAPVYAALSDAQQVAAQITNMMVATTNVFDLDLETNGIGFVQNFQQTLIGMNIAILNDLAWQFEAYKNGGLDALQEIYAVDTLHTSLDSFAINAWQEIDQGIQTGNPSLIQQGNQDLLQREQQQVLANGYAQLSAMPSFVTWGMSQFAKNPVPSGPDFITLEPSGNIAVYNDRWDWITHSDNGMWPLWVGTSLDTQLEQVEVPLTTYATNFMNIPPIIQ